MMMSGKQYSLDSRIDLAEAVEEVNNKVHSYTDMCADKFYNALACKV